MNWSDALADRYIERAEADLHRRQDVEARAAGRAVDFAPRQLAIKPTGPTCPRCTGPVVMTGNMSICNRRGCGYQCLSHVVQADRKTVQVAEKISA